MPDTTNRLEYVRYRRLVPGTHPRPLLSARWNIAEHALGDLENAPGIPSKPYSYQVCNKVDSGICHLHGKGETLQGYSSIAVYVPPDLGMYPILDRGAILCLGRSF